MDTQAKLKAHDTGNSQNHQLIQNLREELTKQKEETSKMSTELANEKDTVSELLRKLKVAEQVKKALNDRLQNTIDEQALQISALKLEVDKLRQDLEVANSRVKELEIEQSNAHIQSILPPPPKRDEKPRFSSPEPVADVRPESPLSEEDLQIRENGEVSSDNKSDSEEEMFDEHSPSPVVPCPYIDFVPLQLDPKRSTKDKAESKPEQVEESGTKKEEEEEAVKEFSVEEREDEKDDENDISETTESASSPPNEDELQSKRKELEAPADIDSPMPSSEHETTSDSVTSPEVKETPLVEDHVTDKVEDKAEDKQEDKAEGEQEEEEEEAEGKTKGKEEEGKPEGDDIQGETENNKPELTEVTAEDQPSGIDPYADFDAIKPHKVLNTSAAVFRSRMGGTIKRKLPSRSHLKKMSSSDDILNNIPKDVLTKLDRALDDSSLPQPSSKEHTPVPQSVPPEEVKETRSTPVPQPKPKPRAAPRKKPQPTPPANLEEPKDEKKPPQAAPRSRMSHDSTDPPKLVKELRPETEKVAKEGEISSMEAAVDKPKEETTSADSDNVPQSAAKPPFRPPQVGPKPSPKRDSGIPPTKDPVEVNPKPSPKREIGKPPAKDPTEVNSVLSDDPALPARSRTGSSEKDTAAPPDLSQKDPSKLTIKEKALLAQKMLSSTPEKIKPGPPVPRKPKPAVATPEPPSDAPPVGVSSTERMKRTQSMDDDLGASPQNQRKKLPPGAFNMMMMGGVSVFGPGAADRGRSATVSTTDPVARERNSLERDMHLRANSPRVEESTIQEESRGVDSVDGPSAESEAKTPHADLMPPVKMASLDEDGPEFDSEAVNEPPSVDTSVQPSANGASDEATSAANVDYNLVLTWTPDVTAAWLSKVGLGSYQQVFVERGVQGYMLFDLDGHALKGMGISSHDDRNLFKKEIKNLKPFADKQKKIIEKQRKEEKKLAKKKKK